MFAHQNLIFIYVYVEDNELIVLESLKPILVALIEEHGDQILK